jgi:HSP20 family molecular chaperone IbpA
MPNEKDVEATYENGVLKLHVMKPVDGTAKTHKVQIKAT